MTNAGPAAPAQLVAFARQAFPMLERMSYYQLLRIQQNADIGAVRTAYYRMAAQLHPDRTHGVTDPTVREQLETIYARITEAYRVLISPEKRVAYDKALATGKMRFESTDRPSGSTVKAPEDSLKDPQAKKFFRLGMMCLGRKDFRGAVMNFNFAKTFEPSARVIIDKLAEATAGMKAGGGPPK
jgi:DnaJ-class molecular chaperone